MSKFNKNISAFLWAIRCCEGTNSADGYRMLFGGDLFEGFEEHPNILVEKSGYSSTAAGAYQILHKTWNTVVQPNINLPDFSPESQDAAAVFLINNRGALEDVKDGRIEEAVHKCNKEWASLPGSPYGQPTYEMESFKRFYDEAKRKADIEPTLNFDNQGLWKDIPVPNDKDKDGISDDLEYAGKPLTDAGRADVAIPEKSFWDRVRHTVKGKNKTGKTIYTIGGAAASVLSLQFLGFDITTITQSDNTMELFEFLTTGEVIATILGLVSLFLGGLVQKKDKEKTEAEKQRDVVIQKATTGLKILEAGKRKDSEKGKALSEGEKEAFQDQAEETLRSIVEWGVTVAGSKIYGLFGREKAKQ